MTALWCLHPLVRGQAMLTDGCWVFLCANTLVPATPEGLNIYTQTDTEPPSLCSVRKSYSFILWNHSTHENFPTALLFTDVNL